MRTFAILESTLSGVRYKTELVKEKGSKTLSYVLVDDASKRVCRFGHEGETYWKVVRSWNEESGRVVDNSNPNG